jgi:predicted enzyme related to lactoylglutathione lyase
MSVPVLQFQILSPAPDDAAKFYSTLFGWTVSADNPMGYRQIQTGTQQGIQGGIWPAPPQAASFVQLFMAVEDVGASVRKAEQMGAKVIIAPTMLPDGGEMAVLHDLQGMSFGVMKKS